MIGAVYTPAWLAARVVERTLVEDMRAIVDPACGDGAFLVAAYEWLAARVGPDRALLRIYGVDLDAAAVASARRALERAHRGRGGRSTAGLCERVRTGDALVDFDWDGFRPGGFDAVVGNPPWVAAADWRAAQPGAQRMVKNRFATAARGKSDLAIPFVELALELLAPGGRAALVVQRRCFETEYGRPLRQLLRERRWVAAIDDFGDARIFAGRTTYSAILHLRAGARTIRYRHFADADAAQADRPDCELRLPLGELDDRRWAFRDPELRALSRELAARHGTLGDPLAVTVGLQTLYGRVYRLDPVGGNQFRNGLGEIVALEPAALRPLCRNRRFTPFRAPDDARVIFPYDTSDGEPREIRWAELRGRFPKTAAYLSARRKLLADAVELPEGRERWHLYTRPQNLVPMPKVLVPMTVRDPVATCDLDGRVYGDNVNVNGLAPRTSGIDLRAVAALVNSTVFAALARLEAGPADGGFCKLNRQFLARVPFPRAVSELAPLAARLLRGEDRWRELDHAAAELYGLSASERALVGRHRRHDRIPE